MTDEQRDVPLSYAVRLRDQGQAEQARDELLTLAERYPDDVEVAYQTAWVHDVLGLGAEAVPFYERALGSAGLSAEDRRGAFVGLGSTYVPAHFTADDQAVRDLLHHHGAADLFTATEQGLIAALLPFAYDPDAGPHGALLGHLARNNSSGACRYAARRWSSCADRTPTSRRPGTPARRTQPGGADLELRHRPRLRSPARPRRSGPAP